MTKFLPGYCFSHMEILNPKKGILITVLAVVVITLTSIINTDPRYQTIVTVDPQASLKTKALLFNLKNLAQDHILFGHQDALAYGVNWKDWHKQRSDVKDIIGKHPAVFGWDVSKIGRYPHNIDTVDFDSMKEWIKEAYKMGGINTISWHMDNFHGGDSWTVGKKVVKSILPGGDKHVEYKAKLDLFADFVKDLKVGFLFKEQIPIVFRPFHEHTGSWFWWGRKHCTADEYIALWRFTVDYLHQEKEIHNLLWVYSPDVFRDKDHYLEYYPGDEYVDILGLDDYHDVGSHGNPKKLTSRLKQLVDLAKEKDKIPALTETGFESIPDESWWTDTLLENIVKDSAASKIAWLLVWRNARKDHHFGPFPGHLSAPNFTEFANSPIVLFSDDLPDLYNLP